LPTASENISSAFSECVFFGPMSLVVISSLPPPPPESSNLFSPFLSPTPSYSLPPLYLYSLIPRVFSGLTLGPVVEWPFLSPFFPSGRGKVSSFFRTSGYGFFPCFFLLVAPPPNYEREYIQPGLVSSTYSGLFFMVYANTAFRFPWVAPCNT